MDKSTLTYSGYLKLDGLLDCQAPLSSEHDELLFIVIHQSAELWLKLCLHELDAVRRQISADDLPPAFKMLSRVARAQLQLIQSWEVLSTMTPSDYIRLREHLGSSSGFQSYQYRLLEFVLGARDQKMVAIHQDDAEHAAGLRAELARPSLYDETLRLLSRRGLPVPASVPPVPTAETKTSTAPWVSSQISTAVVRRCTSGFAGLRNWSSMIDPGISATS